MGNKKYHQFPEGTPVGTDLVLFGDPDTGELNKVTLDDLMAEVGGGGGETIMVREKITLTHDDYEGINAPFGNSGTMWTFPANAVIHRVIVNVRVPFAANGWPLSGFSLAIGTSGSINKYGTVGNIAVAAISSLTSTGSDSEGTAVKATITSTSTFITNLNAGEMDIYIDYSILE